MDRERLRESILEIMRQCPADPHAGCTTPKSCEECDADRILAISEIAKGLDLLEREEGQPFAVPDNHCDCLTKAPTYPTFRSTRHLPECPLYQVETAGSRKVEAPHD